MMKTPKLRFKEFSGDWESKKLGTVCDVTMGQSPSSSCYNEENIGLPLIQGNADVQDRKTAPRIYTSDITKTCDIGDIIMSVRAPVGAISKSIHNACIGRGVCSIKPKENNEFMYQFLVKYEDKWSRISQGSTFESVNRTDIINTKVSIPSKEEQEKIASFFSLIDDKISLQGEKVEALKDYKKGMMQKIFSRELRFKDVDGRDYPEWEEKKLGDITVKVGPKNKENKNFEVYSINNKVGFIPQNEQFEDSRLDSLDKSLYKIINKGEFAYNPARINVGSIGVLEEDKTVIVSSLYVCFRFINNLNYRFFMQYFLYPQFNKDVIRNTEGTVREYLFYENFSNIKVNIPCLEEQNKIAELLDSLDNKIKIEKNKLDSLNKYKKGLLQQMFV